MDTEVDIKEAIELFAALSDDEKRQVLEYMENIK